MKTFHDAGEAMILAHEGQLQLAAIARAGLRRAGLRMLDWLGRMLARTGISGSYTG